SSSTRSGPSTSRTAAGSSGPNPTESESTCFGVRTMSPGDIRTAHTTEPSSNGQMTSLEFLRATLAGLQANVFIAGPKLTIIYANDRALETLRGLAGEVRKAFGVEVDDIVGASIHRFHKDKRRVERILRNPAALPHQAEFAFGNVTLQAKINGVFGPDDTLLGYVVNWEDVSARQQVEAEQARLASMLENAPTNLLLADPDLKIVYVNPASLNTL